MNTLILVFALLSGTVYYTKFSRSCFFKTGKEFPTRYTYTFQDVQGDDEEAETIFREHLSDDVNVADGLHLLRVVGHDRHVHRKEEENHLLGRS